MAHMEEQSAQTQRGSKPDRARAFYKSPIGLALLGAVAIGVAITARIMLPAGSANAQVPQAQRRSPANRPQRGAIPPQQRAGARTSTGGTNVVAVVNREPITRQQLGRLCLVRWGEETLQGLVNKQLITEACHARGIVISDNDIEEEIKTLAGKFNLSVEQYMKMLREERDVSATEYRRDIVWPTIALKRLAADRLTVSKEELDKEFEAEFGEKIQVRMISLTNQAKAQEVLKLAKANPDEFGRLAKQFSADPNSASAKGLIPPVRKHIGDPAVEKAVFALQEGQVSSIVPAANQFFIFRCERRLPPATITPQYRRQAAIRLRERIVERNLRSASTDIFDQLQKRSKIVNVMNDPNLRSQSPGVAAFVNSKPISIEQLTSECLLRFGRDMLESEITYRLLTQELKKRTLTVPQEAVDEEVGRAAMAQGYIQSDGSPDIDQWLESVEKQEGIAVEEYIRDAVWPSVALKQLVGSNVSVTQEDLEKGFEANYGERVKVLAIVVSNQRIAQEVWDMARKKPTKEFFGQLAEQYSIEPISRANYGEIPPIARHSGQPQIEKEAFRLRPNELSGIVAMGDKYIIMRCLGRTDPVVEQAADVQKELMADIREKKLRVAMSAEYERLRQAAQIDNFLVGSTQPGKQAAASGLTRHKTPVRPASSRGMQLGR